MVEEERIGEINRPRRIFESREFRYEGGSVVRLQPESARPDTELVSVVRTVLDHGPYRYGDFLHLPMPVWLVRDEETSSVVRVTVRTGGVELHVLPETGKPTLSAFIQRVEATDESGWHIEVGTPE